MTEYKKTAMGDPEILMTLVEALGPDREEDRGYYLEYMGKKVELAKLKLISIDIEESKKLWVKK